METEPAEERRREEPPGRQWDNVAAGWERWWRTIERATQHVSDRLLDMADVGPGQRVLDIATGIGEPALLAAKRVGPAGRVVATDSSKQMLRIARERAITSGLANVEFRAADAERLDFPDGSFDAVLCRWGLQSLPNPSSALDVRAEKIEVLLEFPSVEAFTRYLMDVSPEIAALVSDQGSDRKEEYVHELAEEVRQRARVDGSVRVQSMTICAAGRR